MPALLIQEKRLKFVFKLIDEINGSPEMVSEPHTRHKTINLLC